MKGFNPKGAIVELETLSSYPISCKADTLMGALYEMFPELSRSEINRLLKQGALRGYFAEKATFREIEAEPIIPSKLWDFVAIQLGKINLGGVGIPRYGFILLKDEARGL